MSSARFLLLTALLGAAFAACNLNPQPLPPGDDTEDKAPAPAAGGTSNDPTRTPTSPSPELGSADGGDASGDATTDAPDGD